jgi:hypothetical protein
MGTALKQEKLKGYITALGEYVLPRSGFVLLPEIRITPLFEKKVLFTPK